ncbi:MAG: DUF2911 domain-containing protein [Candidatus Acidiferrales bacterium]
MKRAMALCSFVLIAVMMMAATANAQQDKASRPSPPASADCTLPGGGTIHVDYSVPSMKGRVIFGKLVPYGEVWRAGANEATTFVISKDVTVGRTAVPAGNYTLFTIPEKDKWTLILSKKTGEWGVPYPGAASDFARIDMKAGTLAAPQEKFSISFDKGGAGCTMKLAWESTQASVEIQ